MHLVIAEAFGYVIEVYRVFILSLRKSGYGGDVALIAPPNRTRPECAAFLADQRVTLVASQNHSARHNADRFLMYAELCARDRYRYCLAADFRDVIFQQNPFGAAVLAPLVGNAVDLVLPLEPRMIGTDYVNAYFIDRKCFGPRVLQQLANLTVICSGVLLGTPVAYAALARQLIPLAHSCKTDKMSDQAALNYLVHTRHEPGRHLLDPVSGKHVRVRLQPAGTGLVNTIGVFKGNASALAFERDHMRGGIVLNHDGSPSPVVHQYDRVLVSTGPRGRFGRTAEAVRFRAIDLALGSRVAANGEWLPQF